MIANCQDFFNGTLKRMGMKEAFGGNADFSKLCECRPGDVFISDVLHKAVIEVNEKGTEAAAVTAITIRLTSAMPADKPFHMVVDRPFLLAIVDDETGLILFIGAISERLRLPGLSAYAASKVGLEAFAETLGKEERKKRITVIRPGAVATPFWDKVPLRLPKDAAPADKVAERIYEAYLAEHKWQLDLV